MAILEKQDWFRPSLCFLSALVMLFLSLLFCYGHALYAVKLDEKRGLVRAATIVVVGSADLSLNNAARYIRHVSLTDVSTAFQDCPGCLDYFPGSLSVNPPDFHGFRTRFE